MKDGLQSAEIRATNISGGTLYAGTSMSGVGVFSSTEVIAGTTVTAGTNLVSTAGSVFANAGSIVHQMECGSLLAGSITTG